MAKNLPRRGTFPANTLIALFAARTTVRPVTLMARVGWTRGRIQFEQEVVNALCGAGLARIVRNGIEITKDGLRFAEGPEPAEVKYIGELAAPRTAIVNRPLRSRSAMVLRPGAMDYRDIPSMMGGVQVPYKSSVRPESK
jgi:hypothetical protein